MVVWLPRSDGADGGTKRVNVLVISALEVEADEEDVDVVDVDRVWVVGRDAFDVVDPERVRLPVLETDDVVEVPVNEDVSAAVWDPDVVFVPPPPPLEELSCWKPTAGGEYLNTL